MTLRVFSLTMKSLSVILTLLCLASVGCGKKKTAESDSETNTVSSASTNHYVSMVARVKKRQALQNEIDGLHINLKRFQTSFGRLPTNLVEMVQMGYLDKIPEIPVELELSYDPVLGNIRLYPRRNAPSPEKPFRTQIKL